MDYYVVWCEKIRDSEVENADAYADCHAYIDFSGNVNLSKNINIDGIPIQFANREVRCIQLIVVDLTNTTLYALFSNGCIECIHTTPSIYPNFIVESLTLSEPIIKLNTYYGLPCMLSSSGTLYFNKEIVMIDSNINNFEICIDSGFLVLYYKDATIKLYSIKYIGTTINLTEFPKFDAILMQYDRRVVHALIHLNSLVLILNDGEIICNNYWDVVKKTENYSIIRIMDSDNCLYVGVQSNKINLMYCERYDYTMHVTQAIQNITTETCYTMDKIRYSEHINFYKKIECKCIYSIGYVKVFIMLDDTVKTFTDNEDRAIEIFDIFEEYRKVYNNTIIGSYI